MENSLFACISVIPHDVSRQVAKKKPSPSSWMLHIFVNSRAIIPFLVPNSIPIGFVPNDPIWRFPEIGVPLNYLIGLNNNCNVPTTEPVAHRQRSILRTQAQRFKPSSLKPHDCGRLIKLNQAIHAAALQESQYPQIIYFSGIFPYKPTILDTSIYGNLQICYCQKILYHKSMR